MDVKAYNLQMEKERYDGVLDFVKEEMPFLEFDKRSLSRRPNLKYEGNEGHMDIATIVNGIKHHLERLMDDRIARYGLVLTDLPIFVEVADFRAGSKKTVYPIGYHNNDIAAVSSFRLGRHKIKKTERTAKVVLYELFETITGFEGGCSTRGCYHKSGDGMSLSHKDIKDAIPRIDHSHRFCRRCRRVLDSLQ